MASSNESNNYQYEENHRPWFVWTLVLAPCFMPAVWNYHVNLDSDRISFGYSAKCAQRQVDRSNILTAEPIDHINGLCEWGGYGIRKQLPSWETGYIAKNGPGVRLTFKEPGTNKELAVTFTCEDPNKIVELLTGAKG